MEVQSHVSSLTDEIFALTLTHARILEDYGFQAQVVPNSVPILGLKSQNATE